MQVGDYVIAFGTYEGIVVTIIGNFIEIYCPAYNSAEPYLTTTIDNVQLSESQEINNGGLPN